MWSWYPNSMAVVRLMILWQLSQAWLHYCLVIPRQLIVLWSCGSCLTRDIYDSMAAVSRFYGSCLSRGSVAVASRFYGNCLSVTFMVPRWLSHDSVAVVSVVVLWRVSHDMTASCLRQLIRWLVFQDSGQFVLNRPCVHTAAVMDILMLFNTEKENK